MHLLAEEPENLYPKGQDNGKGKGKGPGDEGKGKGPADKGKGKGPVDKGKGKGKVLGEKGKGSSGLARRLRPASVTKPGERALTRSAFLALHGPDRAESEPPFRLGGPFEP